MSMSATYYNIIGYDLTNYEKDIIPKDWFWDNGEKYIDNQVKGEIQFFNDPASGCHLYFGYILSEMYEYGDTDTIKIPLHEFNIKKNDIDNVLKETGLDIPNEIFEKEPEFISFVEWT